MSHYKNSNFIFGKGQNKYVNQSGMLLSSYESCDLECDGMTRVVSRILTQHQIAHTTYVGRITLLGADSQGQPLKEFQPHFWIELGDQARRIVDYRARMWFTLPQELAGGAGTSGEEHEQYGIESGLIPHGIFRREDYPRFVYEGRPVELVPLSPAMFEILVSA